MDLFPCLHYAGGLADTPAGRESYLQYLVWLSTSNITKKEQSFAQMCRGWALGTREFKKDLITEDCAKGAERLGHVSQEARELYWERLLEHMLSFHRKSKSDIDRERKSAEWKVMIAHYLKRHTAVTNLWLSRHLNMGVTTGVSRYTSMFETKGKHKEGSYKSMIARIIP